MNVLRNSFLGLLEVLLLSPILVSAATYTVAPNATNYSPNESIVVSWTAPADHNASDWVGIYKVDSANTQYRSWSYLSTATEGSLILYEGVPGTYELRLFTNAGFELVATSEAFTITTDPEVTYILSTDAGTVAAGKQVTVSWEVTGTTDVTYDWIGLYGVDSSNTSYSDWAYTNTTDGSKTFTINTPGTYEFRYLIDNSYTDVATSDTITVTEADDSDDGDDSTPGYSLTVNDTSFTQGDTVTVAWDADADDNLTSDWIGLYAVDTTDYSYQDWAYITSATGEKSFNLPQIGTFEIRYFKNNGYERVATSENFTVTAPDPNDNNNAYTLSTDDTEYAQGATATVSWETDTSDSLTQDWIGLYQLGASDYSYSSWAYVTGVTGELSFALPNTGEFEFRYFKNNSYKRVAISNSFLVTANDNPNDPPPVTIYSVEPDKTSYDFGEIADAVWSGPYSLLDWIGLYTVGSSDSSYLDWEYTDTLSYREQFPLNTEGTFEFRLFKKNSYTKVATSEPFSVTFNPENCNGFDLSQITNYPTGSGPVIALGDSITYGIGATPGQNYVDELEKNLGINIINAGVSGDTTQDALERLTADVLSKSPSTVIVFLGGNDEIRRVYEALSETAVDRELTSELDAIADRLGYDWQSVPLLTQAQTFTNLRSIVDQIQETGANTIVVGFDNYLFNDTVYAAYEDVASDTGSVFIPDIYKNIFGNPFLMSDLVHPNDFGYDIVADRIELGLECLVP